jgi:hypothetical protein
MSGVLHFQNTLGQDIDDISMTYEHPIAPNSRVDWTGSSKYNEFDSTDVDLKDADLANIRLKWEPKVILFTDGSRLDAPQGDGAS